MKKAVTLYLEENLIADLKEKNYNISHLCNESLRTFVDADLGEIEISSKLAAVDVIIRDLREIMLKKQIEYDYSAAEYNKAMSRRIAMEADFLEAQKTMRVSHMIQDLNRNIIALNFDEEIVANVCFEMINRIKELAPQFDTVAHVKRLKTVLS